MPDKDQVQKYAKEVMLEIIEHQKKRASNLEIEIACACDLLNTWARELGVQECDDPYENLNLRDLVDRIWSESTNQ